MPRKKKTNRYGKGTIEWVGRGDRGRYYAKVSVGGVRERYPLTDRTGRVLDDKEKDRALARKLAAKIAARARSEEEQARRRQRPKTMLTVQQLGERWTKGELLAEYGDVHRLDENKAIKSTAWRLSAHVYPVIGDLSVDEVTTEDVARVMASLRPKKLSKRSRELVYAHMRRLFSLAMKPCKLRGDNPVDVDLKPRIKKSDRKLYGFLYPSELVALLGCEEIPVGRRVLYALAVYTGLRRDSLAHLTWGNLDAKHGTLTSTVSKTGLPQFFELPATLVQLLARWHAYEGKPGAEVAIVSDADVGHYFCERQGRRYSAAGKRSAEALRHDLRLAGVDRAQLFGGDDKIERIRFHDLRATFVTWAVRQGRGWGWISDRTGHLDAKMRDRYARQARTLADLDYQPFPDLAGALPALDRVQLSNCPTGAEKGPGKFPESSDQGSDPVLGKLSNNLSNRPQLVVLEGSGGG